MYASGEMVLFGKMFREFAWKETRVLATTNHPKLGNESYALVDAYCVDSNCDCRRVMLNVIRDRDRKHVATINWAFDPDDEDRGPFLDRLNPQSELSDALLDLVGDILAGDDLYVARLERHYQMVKQAVKDPDHEVHGALKDVSRKGPETRQKMRTIFTAASTDDELADLWKKVGLDVPKELVDETVRRGGRMVPYLGALLTDQDLWESDSEGRWAPVHAIFLLQAIKDPSATPYVVDAFRRGLGMDWLVENGDNLVLSFGPQAVESLWGVAADPQADGWGRCSVISGLGLLGLAHEELRASLIVRFQGLALSILDKPDKDVEKTDFKILEGLLENLACLHDETSKGLIDRAFADTRFELDPGYKKDILGFYNDSFEEILSDLRTDPLQHFAPEEEEEDAPRPIVKQAPKVGRNDPCPCGSGKKHKKCCLSG
jgi:hypothetical protein